MIKKIFFALVLTQSISASAAIVDLGNITRDTTTGLEWLDVTETVGLSFNDVQSLMVSGGEFEGWRYATTFEFEQLIINFGFPSTGSCSDGRLFCRELPSPRNFEIIEDIILTLGDVGDLWFDEKNFSVDVSSEGAGFTYGLLAENYNGNPNYKSAALILDGEYVLRDTGEPSSDRADIVSSLQGSIGTSQRTGGSEGTFGSYLVRDITPVPILPAWFLFLSSISCLIGFKRKTKKLQAIAQ